MHPSGRRKRGFSLLELVIVAGIVGLSIAVMVPQLVRARAVARKQTCAAKMKTITMAVIQFEALNGALPPGGWLAETPFCQDQGLGSSFGCYPINNEYGRERNFSWLVLTLPFYGEQALFDQFDFSVPVFQQPNDPQAVAPGSLQCPGGVADAPDYNGAGAQSPARGSGQVYAKGNFSSIISPLHADHQLFFQGALGGFQPGEPTGQPLKAIKDGLSKTLAVTEVRKGLLDWDHRGVWTLPWPSSAVLAADVHHQLQPGESWAQVNLIRQYIPDPAYADDSHTPNNQNQDLGDTLFACRPGQLHKIGARMPCTNIGSFMAAAPRSFHENGANASTLSCSVSTLSNDIDVVVYARLIYTRDGRVPERSYDFADPPVVFNSP